MTPSISFDNVNLDKDAVGGPISMRSATDFDAECDRSRAGSGPISVRSTTDLGGELGWERRVQSAEKVQSTQKVQSTLGR